MIPLGHVAQYDAADTLRFDGTQLEEAELAASTPEMNLKRGIAFPFLPDTKRELKEA